VYAVKRPGAPRVVPPPGPVRELVRLDDDGQSASAEAQMHFAMVGRNGDTVENIRDDTASGQAGELLESAFRRMQKARVVLL